MTRLAIKIDVDTDRGTREGVPKLVEVLKRQGVPATFLFSMGPDNTGKAIRRVFRPGFFKKVSRTNVVGNYGLRTLLNGTLLPAPMIAQRNADVLRRVQAEGFACGIHCWDHFQWQDYLQNMPLETIRGQFSRARETFASVFGEEAVCCGAPGWQCNAHALQVYDDAKLLWASDSRSDRAQPTAFFPKWGEHVFKTLHLSTTLPTLDELMGRPEFPLETINGHYLGLLKSGGPHIHTIHAELEGQHYAGLFEDLLNRAKTQGIEFFDINTYANECLLKPDTIPTSELSPGEIDGRSGTVTVQQAVA